jgi:hypothetical protein
MAAAYYIEIDRRRTGDGTTLFGITVGQEMDRQACEPGDGIGSVYVPAYSREEAVAEIRRLIDQYRDPDNRQPDRPAPTAHNTVLRDSTDAFSMGQFFDRGTLAAYTSP